MDTPLQLLHLDETLVAVNKPAGLPVHRSVYVGPADDFLIDRLRAQVPGPLHLAHRLDRPTSGVLLVGRSAGIAAALGAQFTDGAIAKTYLAVARGWPEPAAGCIDYPVAGAHGAGPRKDARTHYRTLATIEVAIALGRYPQQRYALLQVEPETGRFHQIRQHLAHVHHPLIGDGQHGRSDHNRLYRQHFGVHRLLLHAWRLRLAHPASGATLMLQAPLDDAWRGLLARFDWQRQFDVAA